MFHSLTGKITFISDGIIGLSTGTGIEWEIISTVTNTSLLEKDFVKFYTYLHHTENAMQLFGFLHPQEKDLFLKLISVSGIGPKQAIKILGTMSSEEIVGLIESGDAKSLSRIPGLGQKTASKIILALKGKLVIPEETGSSVGEHEEVIQALVDMGFDKKMVKRVLTELQTKVPSGLSTSEVEQWIFKHAIIELS